MKIATLNINGLRAGLRKGLLEWLVTTDPDILCLQEIKIDDTARVALGVDFPGYAACTWLPAEKKGYSGVAILSKTKPINIVPNIGIPAYDREGRVLLADFGEFAVLNVYLPSGSQGDTRQAVKEAFMADFHPWVNGLLKAHPNLVIVGDFNICHHPIDIHDPVRLKNTSGFLPHERAWFSDFLKQNQLTDSFRYLHPKAEQEYTWWSYRGQAKTRNKGWRLDYQLVSEPLRGKIEAHTHQQSVNLSDHCPTLLTLRD